MGIVAFQWENNQLMLLHNRAHFINLLVKRTIKPAAWDEKNVILSGRDETSCGSSGTWCGISRQGRVAFLLDAVFHHEINPLLFPIDFLEGNMSPKDFAADLTKKTSSNYRLHYQLVVADINLNSMVLISKKIFNKDRIEEVDFGVHTLSSAGLDVELAKDLRLKRFFNKMIGAYAKKKTLPPMKKLTQNILFMYDPEEAVKYDKKSALFVEMEIKGERYKTTCTTTLVVKPTKEAEFYERYWEADTEAWKDHYFPFNIA